MVKALPIIHQLDRVAQKASDVNKNRKIDIIFKQAHNGFSAALL